MTINGNQSINVTPVYGEGLREGFVGKDDNAHNDDETTPNPNRIGGGLPPPEDIGLGFTDPPPPYNNTLDIRMGQWNGGPEPAIPDGYLDAAGKPYGWASSRTFIYTGEIQATTDFLSFAMNTDDTDWLKINGVVVLNDNTWNTPVQALSGGAVGNANLVAGLGLTIGRWYDIEFRMSDTGGGGAGASGQGVGWVDSGDHTLDYGVGINTTGFKQNGANGNTTPLGNSVDGGDYIKPVESADGTPQLFRYLINPGGGGDDLHVSGNAVVSIVGTGDRVVENSIRFEPTTAGATISLAVNNSDATQRTLVANTTLLGNSNNVIVNLDGSSTLRLNNLDDNARTGLVLNKNSGTGEVIISGTAAASGLDGATLSVTDGRLSIEGATDPLVGLSNAIQIKGPNAKLRISTRTGAGIQVMASGTLEHAALNANAVGSVTIDAGQTLLGEISDGILSIAGNLTGNILRKLGVGTLAANGETNLSAVNVEGGRLALNGKTTLAAAPTLTSGTLALFNSGAVANQIPGPLTIPAGTTLEGASTSFVNGAVPNVLNLTGGTLRLLGGTPGLNLNIYDSDPNVTGAYGGALDSFAGVQSHYAALTPAITTVTSADGNTVIRYNPSGDNGVPFAIHGSNDADTIEALFTGKFLAPVAGDYIFDPRSDDGTTVYINGVLVSNNNFGQGIGHVPRPGTVNLAAGSHDITMTFNEGISGAGMFINLTTPGGVPRLLSNSDLLTSVASGPIANQVNVQTNSTIDAGDSLGIAVNSVLIEPNRTLTVTGSKLTANTVTLNGAGTYTFSGAGTIVATTLDDNSDGTVPGGAFDVDLVKEGGGVLFLDNTTTPQLQNPASSITVTAGSVGLLLGGTRQPQGNASINFNGGGVVLSSKGGNQNFAIPVFNGNGALEARQLGTGVPGPVTITLTGNLNLAAAQTLTLGSRDNYTLSIGGTASGTGTVAVNGGTVNATTTGSISGLKVLMNPAGGSAALNVRESGTLTVQSLASSGLGSSTLALGNGTSPIDLVINGSDEGIFAGLISQATNTVARLIRSGTGKQTLTGTANTYSGGTRVAGGILSVLTGGSLGTGAIELAGGTLQTAPAGLLGEYYDVTKGGDTGAEGALDADITGFNNYFAAKGTPTVSVPTTINGRIDLKFSAGAGIEGGGPDTATFADQGFNAINNFAVRFSGFFSAVVPGEYSFTTRSDDGSVIFIDGVRVLDNNAYQAMTTATAPVTLTAGQHTFAVGFYEGTGDNGLEVRYTPPGGVDQFIPNSVLGGYQSANPVSLTANSTIDPQGSSSYFGPLNHTAGTSLTTTAGAVVFARTTLPTAGAYNFANAGQVVLGQITDSAAAITINKSGAGDLVINGTTAHLTNAANVINVTGGNLVSLGGAVNPLGASRVNLNGGGLRLSSTGGNITSANAVDITGSATIAAGNFGPGAVDNVTATLSQPLTIAAAQTLTTESRNSYTLKLGGNVTGAGNFDVAGGIVETNGLLTVNNLDVNAGTLRTTGNVTTTGSSTVFEGATLQFAGNTYSGGLINANGGVVRAESGVTNLTDRLRFGSAQNALRGSLYVAQTGDGILTDAGIATLLARTPTYRSALRSELDFGPNGAGDAKIAAHFGAPVSDTEAFTAAFTGKFTAPATGAFALNGFVNDDTMAFWFDRNQNGVFELAGSSGNELVVQGACCGLDVTSSALDLTSGQSYNVAFVVEDTGGGGSIGARYNTPGAPTLQLVNPSNPQGIFNTPKGGLLVSTGAEMRALTIDGAGDVAVNGTLRLNNTAAASSTVESLHNVPEAGGTVALEAGNTLVAQRFEVSAATTFIKNGDGTLTANSQVLGDGSTFRVDAGLANLNGPANGAGSVVVNNSGTVRVNGAINGSVTVNAGGTLGGTGRVGNVTGAGTVSPGNGAGTLNTGNFAPDAGRLSIELQTPTVHDQLNVTGTVSLQNNPLLEVTLLSGNNVQNNDLFFIIINDGSDPLTGAFSGIPDSGQGRPAFVTLGSQPFLVSYHGDSTDPAGFDVPGGNDVVLMAIPEPQTWATLLSGIGALVGLQRFRRRRGKTR